LFRFLSTPLFIVRISIFKLSTENLTLKKTPSKTPSGLPPTLIQPTPLTHKSLPNSSPISTWVYYNDIQRNIPNKRKTNPNPTSKTYFVSKTLNQNESEKLQTTHRSTRKKKSNISNLRSSNPQPSLINSSMSKRHQSLPTLLALANLSLDSTFQKKKRKNTQNKI
jgi:hypothetical protein